MTSTVEGTRSVPRTTVLSQLSCEMYAIEEHYYKINRIFLKILGLWPYHRSYLVLIQKVLFITTLVTFLIAQLLVLVSTQYDTGLLLKILSFAFPTILVTMKYCLFVIQASSVKRLMEQIHEDWGVLKNKLEMDIIEKYASKAKYYTIVLMAICYFSALVCLIFQLLPIILDVISPLNESRACQLIVITEYFVSQEKYLCPLLIHEILTGYIGATTLSSTLSTIMIYILHICAMFKIASYQIENAIDKTVLAIPSPRREYLLCRRIAHAVVIHQRAVKFVEYLTSDFLTSYIILFVFGVTSLSLNLFQFLQVTTKDSSELFVFSSFIVAHMVYIFLINYGGQKIIDHGAQLFVATYSGMWYAAPLRTQKLILFIMQKGMKSITLTCGYMFVMSLEGFATLTSSAVSYLMVIYSTRK